MATTAAFAATPHVEVSVVSAANTNRDGTGTIVTILTPGASGTRVERIQAKATATTTAGQLRLFVSTDAGSTWRLHDEMAVSAIVPSATVQTFEGSLSFGNVTFLCLASGHRLGMSTHNAETFHITAVGADI
jgi:hypothetical protein